MWRGFDLDWALEVKVESRDEAALIELLNSVGIVDELVSRSEYEFPFTERICNVFCSDPDRFPGLLHVLVTLAVAGNSCLVPREVVERCTAWDDSSKTSALLLAIARNDWDAHDIEQLAQRLLEDENSLYVVWRALQITQRQFPMERSALVALAFVKVLTTGGNWSARTMNELLNVLTEYLTKRPSYLDDAATWHRLRLPEKV